MTNAPMGMAVTVLLPSEPVGWMDGASMALIALSAREGSRVDHRPRKGQGEAWGSVGPQRCEAAVGSWRLLAASCSEPEGPCCWTSIQAPAGPAIAVRTDPQFARPHCASKASPSLAGLGLGFVQP